MTMGYCLSSTSCFFGSDILSIQLTVLNRFSDMLALYCIGCLQIGNGSGQLQDSVISAHAQAQRIDCRLQELCRVLVQHRMFPQEAAEQFAVPAERELFIAFQLNRLCRIDLIPHLLG